MESRQVILLTRAHQSGRLTFNYPNPLSRLREQFILDEIEKEALMDAYQLKTHISANTIPIAHNEGLKNTNKLLTSYLELSLPYVFKDGKLKNDNLGEVTKEKLDSWNATLDGYKKAKK